MFLKVHTYAHVKRFVDVLKGHQEAYADPESSHKEQHHVPPSAHVAVVQRQAEAERRRADEQDAQIGETVSDETRHVPIANLD